MNRSDRRRLMVIADVVRAAVIAGLAAAILMHSAGLVLIYFTAFIIGVGSALRVPRPWPVCPGWRDRTPFHRLGPWRSQFATIAGIRATMLIGATPIAATMIVLTWHHRGASANS